MVESLLHYVWKHRFYDTSGLTTDQGEPLEVIDPGLHNMREAGPDFFNAKLRINGVVWAGNVELHSRASDWYRHRHEQDPSYNNVILHVVAELDAEARTQDGKRLPQLQIGVTEWLQANYRELLAEENYPPCYRVIPGVPDLTLHGWMNRLAVERLEEKTQRIQGYLQRTNGDWERVFFVTVARNFGFGTNAQAFEQWAFSVSPAAVNKHRDNPFQVEAFFMGQAGFLSPGHVPPKRQDDYFGRLQEEYAFLQRKFGLAPMDPSVWKFGRLRPQNFPYMRLSQLVAFYTQQKADFSRLLKAKDIKALYRFFRVGVTPYWRSHYAFGKESAASDKVLRAASLDLLVINSAAPLLFAYARERRDEDLAERAYGLLEAVPAERNHITRCWERAGIRAAHAADSQALIRLRQHYCNRKDCLRCCFGLEYLRMKTEATGREISSGV